MNPAAMTARDAAMTMNEPVAGVILAGGLSRRMGGGDKTLLTVEGKTLLARIVEQARPQVAALVLNANGDPARFAAYRLPVVADGIPGFAGPLAGILAGLDWARVNLPGCRWLVSIAGDAPLLPGDLTARLLAAVAEQGADIGCARSLGRTHPVFGLWPLALAEDLRKAMLDEDMRKIDAWTARYKVAYADWPGEPVDPFTNVNEPEDVVRLEMLLRGETPPLHDSLPVAVVVERRKAKSPWADHVWRPVEVVSGEVGSGAEPRLLRRGEEWEHYLIGGQTLELHRSDLASYRYNLSSGEPRLFVALHPEGEGVRVAMVTLAPDEAQDLMENGEDIVEPVPLSDSLRRWAGLFCAKHPPDRPRHKRKRDNYDPDKAGFGRRERS